MRLVSATKNSVRGLIDGFRTEAALRDEAVLLVLAVPAAMFVAPDMAWYIAMISTVLLTLAVEFLNTAVEKLADHVTPEHHTAIGRIKDFGSAAVFCALSLMGLVWIGAALLRYGWV